jgi:excisionase family DNA binding protein
MATPALDTCMCLDEYGYCTDTATAGPTTGSYQPSAVPIMVGLDHLLTPGEVAARFAVDPKTVTRWAAAGRISSIRTPGGHRRFRESEVRALLEGGAE